MVTPADRREDLLRAALDALGDSPARLERARITIELGTSLRRRNALPQAREQLRTSLDSAIGCGADELARRAAAELRAAAGRPRRLQTTGPAALTPRERELVDLAASGATNREIAESLFLTIKTVETHLRSAYRKLGVQRRAELAAALADDPATRPTVSGP